MLVIDLDFFKNVNDRYGHLFGDKVLQEFARMLRTLFRSSDILVRFGGDTGDYPVDGSGELLL